MTLPLLVRPMATSEVPMVLGNWKAELRADARTRRWGRGLEERDFWCLVNHVLDRITLPACRVFVGCHEDEPDVPVCWVALRRPPGLSTWAVVYLYVRQGLREDVELCAGLERELIARIDRPILPDRRPFNPFLELRAP